MKNTCNIVLLRRAAGRFSFPIFVTVMVGVSSPFTIASLQAEPPTITCQPQHQTNVIGSTITLTVCATGTPPLAYQWFRGSGVLPQGTNATLVLSNVQPSQTGNYTVAITNIEGAVTSDVAYVRVLVPPSITAQPTNFPTLSLGASVSNRVSTTGTAPLGYQWRRDGVNVPRQTNREIVITNLQLADAGSYTVVVANSGGSVTSAAVMLVIDSSFVRTMNGEPNSAESGMWNPYWVDFNEDGRLDLIICGGASLAPRPLVVFENMGGGVLQRNRTNDLAQVTVRGGNLVWADFDNDGDSDLYLTHEESVLEGYWRNDGHGRFSWFLAAPIGTAIIWSADAADYNGDGWLDLLVGCWGSGARTNRLLRGVGGGGFGTATAAGLDLVNLFSESVAWVDYDEDGDLDVLVTTSGNSTQVDHLLVNNGNGVFAAAPTHLLVLQSSAVTGVQSWADYDNDGDLDVAIPRWEDNRPLVYRNLGHGSYVVDLNSPRRRSGGRPTFAQWGDYDNDGDLDLFIANDNTQSQQQQPGRLFRNRGDGALDEILTGSPCNDVGGYGCAWGDYDGDGFLDLVTLDQQPGGHLVYRNNLPMSGNSNAWLKVKLAGTASNRSGVGAAVRVRATIGGQTFWQRRQIVARANEPALEAHFGLGDATNVATLRVEWPSGQVTELHDVAPRQFLTITEEPGMRMTKYGPGDMQIEITAHVGMNIELRVTNDLPIDFRSVPYTNWPLWTNWVPWKTVLQTNRTMIVIDPEASQYPRRFYGARVQ